jgi:OOP family OmpA-OmpF porin
MSQVQGDHLPRAGIPVGVWWLLVAWLVLVVSTVVWAIPHEEAVLADRAEQALAAAGFPVTVDFSGRDAVLSGTVDSVDGPEEAIEIVAAVDGVRHVTSNLEVAAVTVPLRDPSVTVAVSGGRMTLSGLVPDQATSTAIVAAAVGRFGADAVTNEMTVADDVESADWLDRVGEAIADLGSLDNGSAVFGVDGVTLAGVAASPDAIDSLQTSMELLFGDELPVTNRLSVAALASPSLSVSAAGGTVELSGSMPDQASVDALVTAAISQFGSDGVTSTLVVGEVGSPEWLVRLPDLFSAAGGLESWAATIGSGRLDLTGFGADATSVAGAKEAIETLALPDVEATVDIEIDPTALAAMLTRLAAGTVTFAPGSATLTGSSSEVLDEIATLLLANPSTSLSVEGYTEELGSTEIAREVSEAEAITVIDSLVGAGVDSARLTAIGYGSRSPIASNATATGRDQNRRIEFTVREGDG